MILCRENKRDDKMHFAQFNSSQASIKSINTDRYLNDVELAKDLLENAKLNGGELSYADIVFHLRNFLKMK